VLAHVSRCPESAASLVLLRSEAHERGGRGRLLLTVEERKNGRHSRARLLSQREETLNIRDMVGVTVENEEEHDEQSPDRERAKRSPAARPSPSHTAVCPARSVTSRSPCHMWRVWWVTAMTRRDGGL